MSGLAAAGRATIGPFLTGSSRGRRMRPSLHRLIPSTLVAIVAVIAVAACSSGGGQATLQTGVQPSNPERATNPNRGRAVGGYPFVAADVNFMTGMIAHHAQAVLMASWAPTHGAGTPVRLLCERIVVGQTDEIGLMQNWLRDRAQKVPSATATRMHMVMDGVEHDMLMPGMLSDEEMAALDKARGAEFDRLFLTGMIKHHYGAIDMVDELFAANGAGQDEVVFKFASDVWADQSTEIDRMKKMLTPPQGNP
jgi:uncharacterized protein (DUF305 family)